MSEKKRPNLTSIRHLKGRDDETGATVTVFQPVRSKRRVKGWRAKTGLADFTNLCRLELNGTQLRILMCVMMHVPVKGGREAFCTQSMLADYLGIHQSHVAKVMGQLSSRAIVWRVKNGVYAVNAWLMYNGDYESWNQEAHIDPEPVWWRHVDGETGEVS